MTHLKKAALILQLMLCSCKMHAQMADTLPVTHPIREFRGVWVATVDNIDWPDKPGESTGQQQQELMALLNAHQQAGLNAIMFQVRPAADAFYAQSTEPWSKWLTGKQGQAPDPAYDPLTFTITEAHKRGMELHAWFNPYRATKDSSYSTLSPQHITNLKPEWFFIYGGQKLFDPGIPEVREYIVKVILNVVDHYDIDGVHMDDYFYPYHVKNETLKDSATFIKYPNGFTDINDWRRNNVNLLIKMLGDSIHAHNPRMKFGVSPLAVWANQYQKPEGSDTHGGDAYSELFADSRKWIQKHWIDYINPQLYRPLYDPLVAFDKMVDWWSDNTFNRHLYIGQAPYRLFENRLASFKLPQEIPDEIRYLRHNPRVQGSVFFSSKTLQKNPLGFTDSLRNTYYRYPALPPPMLWLDSVAPNAPRELRVKARHQHFMLTWQSPLPARDKEPVYGYVIYRFDAKDTVNTDQAEHILQIQYNTDTTYEDDTTEPGKTYLYVITAIDRLKNESAHSPVVTVTNGSAK